MADKISLRDASAQSLDDTKIKLGDLYNEMPRDLQSFRNYLRHAHDLGFNAGSSYGADRIHQVWSNL